MPDRVVTVTVQDLRQMLLNLEDTVNEVRRSLDPMPDKKKVAQFTSAEVKKLRAEAKAVAAKRKHVKKAALFTPGDTTPICKVGGVSPWPPMTGYCMPTSSDTATYGLKVGNLPKAGDLDAELREIAFFVERCRKVVAKMSRKPAVRKAVRKAAR